MSDVGFALLAAFGGAVVAGGASAVGSYWVSKRQWSRELRTEIFRVLLPFVWRDGPDQPHQRDCDGARWDDLIRAAESLGGQDARHARAIQRFLWEWDSFQRDAEGVDEEGDAVSSDPDAADRAARERRQLRRVLSDYDRYVQRRLGGLAALRPSW